MAFSFLPNGLKRIHYTFFEFLILLLDYTNPVYISMIIQCPYLVAPAGGIICIKHYGHLGRRVLESRVV